MVSRTEPPPEHRGKRWHWLQSPTGEIKPWQWEAWANPTTEGGIEMSWTDGSWELPPDRAAQYGYVYLAPAIPPSVEGE